MITNKIYDSLILKFGDAIEQRICACFIAEEIFQTLHSTNNLSHVIRFGFSTINKMGENCIALFNEMRSYAYLNPIE